MKRLTARFAQECNFQSMPNATAGKR